jgi:sulfatase modifying factor 1
VTGSNATCVLDGGSGTLGAACTSDSECPANSWCSTVSGYRRCSPRVFSGAAHQMDFVFVPLGTFEQGTPGATNDERPYTATISRNYFVSRTEVTQGQWKAATGGTNGSCFQSTTGTSCTTSNANNNGPVERVEWYSTLAYANWLSVNQGLTACYTLTPSTCADAVSDWATGDTACTGATFTGLTCTGYRLLTESEWERAARGGMTSTYYWGTATDTATVGLYAWFGGNAGSRTQAVGGKQANAYGLHDMSGNVWEWVWDWVNTSSAWIPYPSGSATDYIGPFSGSSRGIRGGGWGNVTSVLRSANRVYEDPSGRNNDIGFRLARTAN